MKFSYHCNTIEEAQDELDTQYQDVLGDMGEEAAEAGYYDLIRNVMSMSSPEVAAELARREGIAP